MTKKIDQIFCGLMALAALGHFFGTLKFTQFGSGLFVWSLAGVLAAGLIASINILRVRRPGDKAVAWLAFTGSVCWLGIVCLFGQSIGNYLDFRVLFHGVAAAGLSYFSYRGLKG